MCNACGFMCCAWDGFGGCGCDDCDEPECWSEEDDYDESDFGIYDEDRDAGDQRSISTGADMGRRDGARHSLPCVCNADRAPRGRQPLAIPGRFGGASEALRCDPILPNATVDRLRRQRQIVDTGDELHQILREALAAHQIVTAPQREV